MKSTSSTVWLPPELIQSRFDGNYNSPLAVKTRAKLLAGIETRLLADVCVGMRCGPFGSTIVASEYSNDGNVVLVQPTDISNGGFTQKPGWRITKQQLDEKGLTLIPADSLLFARKGIYAHCAVLPSRIGDATLGSSMIGAVVDKKKADPYFLESYFRCRNGNIILRSLQMITASPTIGTAELAEAILPYPTRLIQASIGHMLRAAETLRSTAQSAKEAIGNSFPAFSPTFNETNGHWLNHTMLDTERLESQYYQHRFLELMKIIDALPYKVVPLRELVTSMRHGASVTGVGMDVGGVRFIRGNEIENNRVSTSDVVFVDGPSISSLADAHFVKEGDLLVTRSGTVGMCAVATAREIGSAFGSFVISVQLKKGNSEVSAEYVGAFLNSQLGQAQFRREENGAVQMNINNAELGRIRVPVLNEAIRDEIEKSVRQFNNCLDRAELLESTALSSVDALIDGKLDESQCIRQGRELAEEFGLEPPK